METVTEKEQTSQDASVAKKPEQDTKSGSNDKDSSSGWWHRASRAQCVEAERKLIEAFVDSKQISFEVRDVTFPFDSRPLRVQQKDQEPKKCLTSRLFRSSSSSSSNAPTSSSTSSANNRVESLHTVIFKLKQVPKSDSDEKKDDSPDAESPTSAASQSAPNAPSSPDSPNDVTEEKSLFNNDQTQKNIATTSVDASGASGASEISESDNNNDINIVFAHGYFNALGCFVPAISFVFDQLILKLGRETVCKKVTIYCIDWLGCGLSSKPKFLCETTQETERFFIDSLEQWRLSLGIDRIFLSGHSVGGYCSAVYTLKYFEHVRHLILISPAGVSPLPAPPTEKIPKQRTSFRMIVGAVEHGLTPAKVIRAAGPKGRKMMQGLVDGRFARAPNMADTEYGDKLAPLMGEYLYHATYGSSSGENCLNKILQIEVGSEGPGLYAQHPLFDRIPELAKYQNGTEGLRVDFLYGEVDWMDSRGAFDLEKEQKLKCKVWSVDKAGHQVALENREMFARIVSSIVKDWY